MSDLLRCFCNRSRGHGRVFGDGPAEVPEGPIACELHGVAGLHYVGLWFINPQSVSLAKMPRHAGSCCVLPFLESLQETLKNGRGKFLGFAKSISDCKTKYACATQTRQRETVQAYEPCSNIQHACEPTVVRLSCFGFYGLSFVSNDGPRKPLEFQKLPSGDLQIVYLTRHMAHQDVWCDTIEMHQSFNLCRIPTMILMTLMLTTWIINKTCTLNILLCHIPINFLRVCHFSVLAHFPIRSSLHNAGMLVIVMVPSPPRLTVSFHISCVLTHLQRSS